MIYDLQMMMVWWTVLIIVVWFVIAIVYIVDVTMWIFEEYRKIEEERKVIENGST